MMKIQYLAPGAFINERITIAVARYETVMFLQAISPTNQQSLHKRAVFTAAAP